MALDDGTLQERLTPETRRAMLRAFADRMLLKITAMDDPEDLPGVERAVRTAAAIERIYSRCDRARAEAPDPKKLEAEHARHTIDALEARVTLANRLEWAEKRSQDLGKWWHAADTSAQTQTLAPVPAAQPEEIPEVQPAPAASASAGGSITVLDYTDTILAACAQPGLGNPAETERAEGPDPPD